MSLILNFPFQCAIIVGLSLLDEHLSVSHNHRVLLLIDGNLLFLEEIFERLEYRLYNLLSLALN